jgi:diaminopimelate decarboxylase
MSAPASISGSGRSPADGRGIPAFWESDALEGFLASSDRPFFLYDTRVVERRILRLRERLGPDFTLYYAVKANPNPELLRWMARWTDGADVSSAGELRLALDAGFGAASVSFAGPGKTDAEIRSAVRHRIGSFSVESVNELRRVDRTAGESGETANVSLRINPVRLVKEFAIKMGGKASQFGIDEERIGDFFGVLPACPHCRFTGIHVYAGTQCLDADALADNFKNTLELVRTVFRDFHAAAGRINFGGGFGVPLHENQTALDEDSVCRSMRSAFAGFLKDGAGPGTAGILELGRYLVAEAGIYAARIQDIKTSRGRTYCVLDGGMNHHLAASGNFGQVIRKNYRIRNLSRTGPASPDEVTLVGPLCTSIDVMGDRVRLAAPEIGDWIGFLNSGAYAFSASPLQFLSHDRPREWMVDPDGGVREISRPADGGGAW